MGKGDFGGKGMGKVGEVDEGWLKDRNAVRAKAHFTMLMMFPRSPTPVREMEAAGVAAPVQMTPEEEERAKKFQEGLKKAVKGDAKDSKKKEKKKDKEEEDTSKKDKAKEPEEPKEKKSKKDKEDSKEPREKDKKDKKEKKEKADADGS